MPPDLNSLPPSQSRSPRSGSPLQSRVPPSVYPSSTSSPPHPSHLRRTPSPSPRSSSVSLAAAATMNALDLNRRSSITSTNNPNTSASRPSPGSSRTSERRRSAVAMTMNLNDPSIPGPGELSSSDHRSSISGIGHHFRTQSPGSIGGSLTIATGDPHHHHQRAPSLGEIHQELEQEQEAQVNRLLQMIRTQQAQLQALQLAAHQSQSQSSQPFSAAVIDDSTPTSERSLSFHTPAPSGPPPPIRTNTNASVNPTVPRRSTSRPSSRTTSPALRPLAHVAVDHIHAQGSSNSSSGEWPSLDATPPAAGASPGLGIRGGSRDESAFYQAETQMLTRENQMLRLRIRELERQISDLNALPANSPATPSNLGTSPPVEMEDIEGDDAEKN